MAPKNSSSSQKIASNSGVGKVKKPASSRPNSIPTSLITQGSSSSSRKKRAEAPLHLQVRKRLAISWGRLVEGHVSQALLDSTAAAADNDASIPVYIPSLDFAKSDGMFLKRSHDFTAQGDYYSVYQQAIRSTSRGLLVDIKSGGVKQRWLDENPAQLFILQPPEYSDRFYAIPRKYLQSPAFENYKISKTRGSPSYLSSLLPFLWPACYWETLIKQLLLKKQSKLKNPWSTVTMEWSPELSSAEALHEFSQENHKSSADSILNFSACTESTRREHNIQLDKVPFQPLGGDLALHLQDPQGKTTTAILQHKATSHSRHVKYAFKPTDKWDVLIWDKGNYDHQILPRLATVPSETTIRLHSNSFDLNSRSIRHTETSKEIITSIVANTVKGRKEWKKMIDCRRDNTTKHYSGAKMSLEDIDEIEEEGLENEDLGDLEVSQMLKGIGELEDKVSVSAEQQIYNTWNYPENRPQRTWMLQLHNYSREHPLASAAVIRLPEAESRWTDKKVWSWLLEKNNLEKVQCILIRLAPRFCAQGSSADYNFVLDHRSAKVAITDCPVFYLGGFPATGDFVPQQLSFFSSDRVKFPQFISICQISYGEGKPLPTGTFNIMYLGDFSHAQYLIKCDDELYMLHKLIEIQNFVADVLSPSQPSLSGHSSYLQPLSNIIAYRLSLSQVFQAPLQYGLGISNYTAESKDRKYNSTLKLRRECAARGIQIWKSGYWVSSDELKAQQAEEQAEEQAKEQAEEQAEEQAKKQAEEQAEEQSSEEDDESEE